MNTQILSYIPIYLHQDRIVSFLYKLQILQDPSTKATYVMCKRTHLLNHPSRNRMKAHLAPLKRALRKLRVELKREPEHVAAKLHAPHHRARIGPAHPIHSVHRVLVCSSTRPGECDFVEARSRLCVECAGEAVESAEVDDVRSGQGRQSEEFFEEYI